MLICDFCRIVRLLLLLQLPLLLDSHSFGFGFGLASIIFLACIVTYAVLDVFFILSVEFMCCFFIPIFTLLFITSSRCLTARCECKYNNQLIIGCRLAFFLNYSINWTVYSTTFERQCAEVRTRTTYQFRYACILKSECSRFDCHYFQNDVPIEFFRCYQTFFKQIIISI